MSWSTEWCSYASEIPMARVVPVLARWEADVLELAATADDEFLVGGYSTSRNRASALTASLRSPLDIPSSLARACDRPGSCGT